MSLNYFGTDGIRGPVGGPHMNPQFLRRVGYGLGHFLIKHNHAKPVTVVIGRDTRASGEFFQQVLSEGLHHHGIHVIQLEVLPTPAVSMMVRDLHADLGIVLTASHNPATDNGLKLFDNRGLKFGEDTEAEFEAFIDREPDHPEPPSVKASPHSHEGRDFYMNFMRSLLHQNCLNGWKIVLDTANGSTCRTSPEVFRHFGAELILIGNQPDGTNINRNVGSEHPELLAQAVLEHGARLGIAHDGDGDRLVLCSEKGKILAGEEVLGFLALHALEKNKLARKTLVTTVQSNEGLQMTLEAAGGKMVRVPVGDRNVAQLMFEKGFSFGGESSGHIIFAEHAVSGDGLLAAIKTVEIMLETGLPLSSLAGWTKLFPSATRAIPVARKKELSECPRLEEAMREAESALKGKGRILVRYSGTEPKLRLLVEAERQADVKKWIKHLEQAVAVDFA